MKRLNVAKKAARSIPRRTVVGVALLAVAGFLAAIGTAGVSRIAATTTVATTTAATTTTGTTTAGTTTTGTTTTSSGCTAGSTATVSASAVTLPDTLRIAGFTTNPKPIPGGFSSISATVKITDSCGQPVQNASVYVTAVPYRQVATQTGTTASDGTVTFNLSRLGGFPADSHQELMVFFIRAVPSGASTLSPISARRLVSVHVHL